MNLTRMFNGAVKKAPIFIKRHGSTMLAIGGSIGVVVTGFLVRKAAKEEVAQEATEEEITDYQVFYNLTDVPKTKSKLRLYLPSVISGTATVLCILGSNYLNQKRQASLVAAYILLDKKLKDFRTQVEEHGGIDILEEIRKEDMKEQGVFVEENSSDKVLFYEPLSNRWFWETPLVVRNAEYHFNRNLALRGFADLNEFYSFLGLEPTEDGAILGWSIYAGCENYGYSWVDFDHIYNETDEADALDSPPYYTIYMPFEPTADYMEW